MDCFWLFCWQMLRDAKKRGGASFCVCLIAAFIHTTSQGREVKWRSKLSPVRYNQAGYPMFGFGVLLVSLAHQNNQCCLKGIEIIKWHVFISFGSEIPEEKRILQVGDIGIILCFSGLYFITNQYLAYQMFKELRLPPNHSIPVSILMIAQIWVQKGHLQDGSKSQNGGYHF